MRDRSRRRFLHGLALAGPGFWALGGVRGAGGSLSLGNIQFACIGVGGKGESDAKSAAAHGEIVAICDTDSKNLEKAGTTYPRARRYRDFREMLDQLSGSIDAVTVSTPDHTHAVAAVKAMELGKHCFCQKPLAHDLFEARRMADVARRQRIVTQMDNQGTAADGLRRAAELIRSGAIGAVREVHVWTNRPIWRQGLDVKRPATADPPTTIDWDLWLGPAPARPYGDGYHPFAWRGWWDFGIGALDMGSHLMNMPFMALDLRNPESIEAETAGHDRQTYPKWSIIRYQFPAIPKRPPVAMTWYDGGKRPPAPLFEGQEVAAEGALLVADEGKLYSKSSYGEGVTLLPTARFRAALGGPTILPTSPGHFLEFVDAIRGGDPPVCNFPDYAGPLTETVLLGNLAIWAGRRIEWDSRTLSVRNAPELDSVIRRPYRAGYSI
jgi:predicted dehydrogenase